MGNLTIHVDGDGNPTSSAGCDCSPGVSPLPNVTGRFSRSPGGPLNYVEIDGRHLVSHDPRSGSIVVHADEPPTPLGWAE